MSVMLLTPFTMVNRRSAPMGPAQSQYNPSDDFLTGRWGVINAAGEVVLPGAGPVRGCYLILEGNLGHNGTAEEFEVSPPYMSTSSFELPSVQQSGEVALAYGVFRYEVGPEGCDPKANFVNDGYVQVDQWGRIVPSGTGGISIGKVESVATDANGVTQLVIRTFGN